MRSADAMWSRANVWRLRVARWRGARVLGVLSLVATLLALGSCADGFAPLSDAPVVEGLTVAPVRVNAVRLAWPAIEDAAVVSYVIERRADLRGAFAPVAQLPRPTLTELVWLDTDVAPETFYGYRIRTVTAVGDRSKPSVVGGARTPPLPGIDVITNSIVTAATALDPDGYEVVISGPDTIRAAIGVEATRRFSPLRSGAYTVTLDGLIGRCSASPASRALQVTDTLATTIVLAPFEIRCKDPSRGDVRVALALTGADLDPSVTVDILGEANDATLPPAERTYSARQNLSPGTRSTLFANLHPGTYDVSLTDLAANCTLQGASTRTVNVVAQGETAVTFAVNCVGSTAPVDSTRPFILRNRFTPATAANSAPVLLVSELDLSARTGFGVVGIQADYFYDPAVLRYDSTNVARLPQITVNGNTPGKVSILAASTTARTGVVKLLELAFTVIGTTGQSANSTTQGFKASSRVGSSTLAFGDSVRIEEDTLSVSAAGANNAPVAQAGGPYAGTVGTPLTLLSTGSSDSDGSIASYAWSFGDNTTGTGATVNKTYVAAGTYTVTLTVTDDDGATATDQATVTITAAGGGTGGGSGGGTGGGSTPGNVTWYSTFGTFDTANNWVPLTLAMNLASNVVETPGAEAVRTFVVDTLVWDPTKFTLMSINLGPGVSGSVNQSSAAQGRLTLAGSIATANQSGDAFGVLTFATIRLRPIGAVGSSATTRTVLGPIQGPASTNFFVYNPRLTLIEGSFTRP